MKILQLMLRAGPTSVPFTQYTLPRLDRHAVTLCTFLPGRPLRDRHLNHHDGTGNVLEFLTSLRWLVRRQSFDIVEVHDPWLGFALLIVGLMTRVQLLSRTILYVHGSYRTYSWSQRWVLLLLFACCARIVCCGHAARRSFPGRHRWCAGRRMVTIRHSVDLDLVDRLWPIRPGTDWFEPPPLSLVTVGHLRTGKNHATILRALAQSKSRSARLTVIGDGPLQKPLRNLAWNLKIGARVDFVGEISRTETLKRLWDADGFISMSQSEGLPLGALEAMGCFCPVVLSDIVPHREIRGRRTDLIPLIPANNPKALAQAIDAWDNMPADVRRCWGADCRLHIEPRFALTRMLQKLDRLHAELVPATTPEWEIFCRCVGGRR